MFAIILKVDTLTKQECIPVECVPCAAVAVLGGGVWPVGCMPRGVST